MDEKSDDKSKKSNLQNAKRNNVDSKPAIAYNFAKNISNQNPESLKSLSQLLRNAISLAKGE